MRLFQSKASDAFLAIAFGFLSLELFLLGTSYGQFARYGAMGAAIAGVVALTYRRLAAAARRTRCIFSLRLMLIAVALLAVLFAWIGTSANWLIERHELLRDGKCCAVSNPGSPTVRPPFQLMILGEKAVSFICVGPTVDEAAVLRLKRLFPEASFLPLQDTSSSLVVFLIEI